MFHNLMRILDSKKKDDIVITYEFFARFPSQQYFDYGKKKMIQYEQETGKYFINVETYIPEGFIIDKDYSSFDEKSTLYVNHNTKVAVWCVRGTDKYNYLDMNINKNIVTGDFSGIADGSFNDVLISIIDKYKRFRNNYKLIFASHSQGATIQLALLDMNWDNYEDNDPLQELRPKPENVRAGQVIGDYTQYVDKAYFFNTGYPGGTVSGFSYNTDSYFARKKKLNSSDKIKRLNEILNFYGIEGDLISKNIIYYPYGHKLIIDRNLGLFDLGHSLLYFLNPQTLGFTEPIKKVEIQIEDDPKLYIKDPYLENIINQLLIDFNNKYSQTPVAPKFLIETSSLAQKFLDADMSLILERYTKTVNGVEKIQWLNVQKETIELLRQSVYTKAVITFNNLSNINNIEDLMAQKR